MKPSLIICVATATLVLTGAGAANAGEVNGNGVDIPAPDHAASECAFSGLDTLDADEMQPPMYNDDAFAVRATRARAESTATTACRATAPSCQGCREPRHSSRLPVWPATDRVADTTCASCDLRKTEPPTVSGPWAVLAVENVDDTTPLASRRRPPPMRGGC